MNTQSTGSVNLASKGSDSASSIRAEDLRHPYDRRVAVEAMREVTKVTEGEPFKQDTARMLHGPAIKGEEDILEWWRGNTSSTWHMCGTCKMGKEGDVERVVDKGFRFVGTQGFRVMDTSVVPIMPNNHTQTTAYLVEIMGGDRSVQEYGLGA